MKHADYKYMGVQAFYARVAAVHHKVCVPPVFAHRLRGEIPREVSKRTVYIVGSARVLKSEWGRQMTHGEQNGTFRIVIYIFLVFVHHARRVFGCALH